MWLVRVLGPLVHGVMLDRDGSGQSYYPTWFFAHLTDWALHGVPTFSVSAQLMSKDPTVRERIPVRYHLERWAAAASRMRDQTPIRFENSPSVDDLLQALDSHRAINQYDASAARCAILLCISCSRVDDARKRLATLEQLFLTWPQHLVDSEWAPTLSAAIADPEAHRSTERYAFTSMKLAAVPYCSVLGCTDDPRR